MELLGKEALLGVGETAMLSTPCPTGHAMPAVHPPLAREAQNAGRDSAVTFQ